MSTFTIYHNPRCSKSRETLALLEKHGITPMIKLYIEKGLTKKEIHQLEKLLDLPVEKFVRKKESLYKELQPTAEQLIDTLVQYPKLLERPIVIKDDVRAVIGRPPENILSLIS